MDCHRGRNPPHWRDARTGWASLRMGGLERGRRFRASDSGLSARESGEASLPERWTVVGCMRLLSARRERKSSTESGALRAPSTSGPALSKDPFPLTQSSNPQTAITFPVLGQPGTRSVLVNFCARHLQSSPGSTRGTSFHSKLSVLSFAHTHAAATTIKLTDSFSSTRPKMPLGQPHIKLAYSNDDIASREFS